MPSYVQSRPTVENDGSATTIADTFASAVGAGSTLWCVVSFDSAMTLSGVADSVNGAWTLAIGVTQTNNVERSELWYKANSAAGTPTVTATFATAADFRRITIEEVSGTANAAPEKVAASQGNSAAPNSGSQTTTVDGQFIAGGLQINAVSISNANGFTVRQLGTAQEAVLLDKIQATAGAIDVSVTTSGGSWAALMATLKPTAGATVALTGLTATTSVGSIAGSVPRTAALSGTAVGGITETNITAGGKTIVITLSGDSFIP